MKKIEKNPKKIAILGSTGSIGRQALEVITEHPQDFKVWVLTAHRNVNLLIEQIKIFQPFYVVIDQKEDFLTLKNQFVHTKIQFFYGKKALEEVVQDPEIDLVLNALVGAAGLLPTISSLKAGKKLALANKESLVIAGELVMNLAKKHQTQIFPIDSEHSAIFQCLKGEPLSCIDRLHLTASGGPFFNKKKQDLINISPEQALKHPTWQMGAKISIDSATLMNKGFEVIEAHWLFEVPSQNIEVLVHPSSFVHSMVSFVDGSVKAQLGLPNMKLPIQYAFYDGNYQISQAPKVNFLTLPALEFFSPDLETFQNLALAYWVLNKKGNAACALNAANEVAVELFLAKKISFLDISDYNTEVLAQLPFVENPSLIDYLETDAWARTFIAEKITKKYKNFETI